MLKTKGNKGITLVALVVTVIVLIILAAVTINLVVGQNGIITRAQQGAENYKVAEQDEQDMLSDADKYIAQLTGEGYTEDDYVKDGLIVLYDGENNTGNGHDATTTTWKNLAPSGSINDGKLVNIDFNNSGWTLNSLVLDGIDDWVRMSYIYNENMTVEIVSRQIGILDSNKSQIYIANQEAGGIAISSRRKYH